jgi:hypothetical protein
MPVTLRAEKQAVASIQFPVTDPKGPHTAGTGEQRKIYASFMMLQTASVV